MLQPLALSIKMGVPPTALKALTGEFTPPTKFNLALVYKSLDFCNFKKVFFK
jgi:hypothetical protein